MPLPDQRVRAGLGFERMIMYEAPYVPTPAVATAKMLFLAK